MENSPFSLGKSTINGPCSIAFTSYVQDHNQPTVIHDIPILFHGLKKPSNITLCETVNFCELENHRFVYS